MREVEVIPLTHANAAEIARTLTLLADDKTRAAGRSVARLRRHAHEFDPDLGREGGTAASCARSSRISIRRSTTAATRR